MKWSNSLSPVRNLSKNDITELAKKFVEKYPTLKEYVEILLEEINKKFVKLGFKLKPTKESYKSTEGLQLIFLYKQGFPSDPCLAFAYFLTYYPEDLASFFTKARISGNEYYYLISTAFYFDLKPSELVEDISILKGYDLFRSDWSYSLYNKLISKALPLKVLERIDNLVNLTVLNLDKKIVNDIIFLIESEANDEEIINTLLKSKSRQLILEKRYSTSSEVLLSHYGIHYRSLYFPMEKCIQIEYGIDVDQLNPINKKFIGQLYNTIIYNKKDADAAREFFNVIKATGLFAFDFCRRNFRAFGSEEQLVRFPDGSKASLKALVDEIKPDMIPRSLGLRAFAANVFAERERVRREEMEALSNYVQPMGPFILELPEELEVVHLDKAVKLSNEGAEMRHCVANYAKDIFVNKRSSYVFSVRKGKERVTLMISGNDIGYQVSQCYGNGNSVTNLSKEVTSKLKIYSKLDSPTPRKGYKFVE